MKDSVSLVRCDLEAQGRVQAAQTAQSERLRRSAVYLPLKKRFRPWKVAARPIRAMDSVKGISFSKPVLIISVTREKASVDLLLEFTG